MKLPTGVKRLDELLKGGLPEKSSALLFGPPFVGKEVLIRRFAIECARQKQPALVVLTDTPAAEFRKLLLLVEPKLETYEKAGLLRYIDTYSRSIGSPENTPNTEFVDGLLNFNAVSLAVNKAEREFIRQFPQHALAFDSLSTLIAYTNAATAFRYLQVLLGKVKAAGGTTMMTLSQGMHTDAEVQSIKHLADGMIELRADQGKNNVHVEGLGITEARGWVEYRFTETDLEITGSFAAGRIR